jgi:hypothetical protein
LRLSVESVDSPRAAQGEEDVVGLAAIVSEQLTLCQHMSLFHCFVRGRGRPDIGAHLRADAASALTLAKGNVIYFATTHRHFLLVFLV